MNFCPDCENYLALKIKSDESTGRQIITHMCRNCGYTANIADGAKTPYIYKSGADSQKLFMLDKNVQYMCDDPTLPRVSNIPCPNKECATHKDGVGSVGGDVVYYCINEKNMKFVYLC
jgi:hypothetical protein